MSEEVNDNAKKYSESLAERREWYQAHKESERARCRAYGASHREEKRAAVKKCYYAKREYYLEKRKEYVKANHEKVIMKKRLARIKVSAQKEVNAHPELSEVKQKKLYDDIVAKLCRERNVDLSLCC